MKRHDWPTELPVLIAIFLSAVFISLAGGSGVADEKTHIAAGIPSLHTQATAAADEGLSKGKFLVATDRIADPRFSETVVLLINYDKGGTMGLIINRPTDVKLSMLFPEIKELQKRSDAAFIGGPVGMEQVFMLVRSETQPEESLHVFRDVYVSTSMKLLQQAAGAAGKGPKKFRLYAGYAGWAAGQLEREVAKGDWHILQADSATVFDKNPEKVWKDMIRRSSAIQVKSESPATDLLMAKVP